MTTPEFTLDEDTREELDHIFEILLDQYHRIAPDVVNLERTFESRGEVLEIDHIAIRTFGFPRLGIDLLQRVFTERGFRISGHYTFQEKGIRAVSLSPPVEGYPRIFLSELVLDGLPEAILKLLTDLEQSLAIETTGEALLGAERNWPPISQAHYRTLNQFSPYAGWVAAHGIRVNHKAWSVNAMMTLNGLEDINAFVESAGMTLAVKGASERHLRTSPMAQSSTFSDTVQVAFDALQIDTVPGGYVEFTHRFRCPSGEGIYDGFVEPQANVIFDSTNGRTP